MKRKLAFEWLENRLVLSGSSLSDYIDQSFLQVRPTYTTKDAPANHLTASGSQLDGVVEITVTGTIGTNGYTAIGTGSLLPNGKDILTAAHVITLTTDDSASPPTISSITVTFQLPTGTVQRGVSPTTGIHVNPNWDRGDLLSGNDVAVLELTSAAPADAPRFDILS